MYNKNMKRICELCKEPLSKDLHWHTRVCKKPFCQEFLVSGYYENGEMKLTEHGMKKLKENHG